VPRGAGSEPGSLSAGTLSRSDPDNAFTAAYFPICPNPKRGGVFRGRARGITVIVQPCVPAGA
jgi:hypothetical protein